MSRITKNGFLHHKEHFKLFTPVSPSLKNSAHSQKYLDNQSKALKEECAQRYPTPLVRLETGRGSVKLEQLSHSCTSTTGALIRTKQFANISGMPLGVRWFFRVP